MTSSCNDVMRLQINVHPKQQRNSHEPAISSAVFHSISPEDTVIPDVRDVPESVTPQINAVSSKRQSRLHSDDAEIVNSFSGSFSH